MSPARALALAAVVSFAACEQRVPLVVPGPTTARPEELRPVAPPAPAAGPAKIALRTPDARVVAIRVAFAAGSADDPQGREGLTRLTATVMAEGGTRDLSYADLVDRLYPLAATIDAQVDRDETVFTATVPRAALDRFYPLLRDVLLAPRFDAEAFARLRARQTSALVSELRGANDEELGKEALQSILYEGHPYGHPAVGTERGLAAITLEDAQAQYTHVFCKNRVIVGIAGGYPEGFDETVARDLAALPPCPAERASLPEPPARKGFQLLVVDKPTAGATAISIGFPTPVTRADVAEFPGLLFATDLLGLHRERAGRLFEELREKRGLNYGDYAYAEHFVQDAFGRFARPNVVRRQQLVTMWLRPVKRANSAFALRAALRVYTKLADEGVSEGDLARMRDYLSRLVGLEQQTESRRVGYAMDDRSYGNDTPYAEVLRRGWKDLDPAKLRALMAKRLDTKNLAIAIVGKDGQQLADELIKGDPSPVPTYDSPKPADVQSEDREIARFPVPLDRKAVRVVPVAEMFR